MGNSSGTPGEPDRETRKEIWSERENGPNRSQGCQERFVCSWGRVVMGTVVIGQSLARPLFPSQFSCSLFSHLSIFSAPRGSAMPGPSRSSLARPLNFFSRTPMKYSAGARFRPRARLRPPTQPSQFPADVRKHVLMRFRRIALC